MEVNDSLYIVTGATGGIGTEIARQLASEGKHLVLACRNMQRAKTLAEQLVSLFGCPTPECIALHLESPESVKKFASEVKKLKLPVVALINNAGIMCKEYTTTDDGREMTFAVNFTGTVMLTVLIEPLMADRGTVVFTTSLTRKFHPSAPGTDNELPKHFSQLGTYSRSKSAITHFAIHAAGLYPRLIINCADPGIVNSNMITMHRWFDPLANIFFRPFIRSPKRGAEAILKALTLRTSANVATCSSAKPLPHNHIDCEDHARLMASVREFLLLHDVKLD